MPPQTEPGAASAFSQPPTLDGTRPGIVYFNLHDSAEWPKWCLSTTVFHEGLPGHQLEGGLALANTSLPLIRKVTGFSGYAEGWALYAEQLSDEMGVYNDDPMGRIGFLHDAMFRAVRLVVDSGMHAMKWSRETALKFYVDTLGDTESSSATEIERYSVQPGQACGYMLGKLTFLAARKKGRDTLGSKFDIKSFHDAMLVGGAVPLAMIDGLADRYIVSRRG